MARSLIEERYTWPVRTVLLGGGSLWATSYQISLTLAAIAVPVLVIVAWIGFLVMARRSATSLAGLCVLANTGLLIPTRDTLVISAVLLLLGVLLATSLVRLRRADHTLATGEGTFARFALALPLMVIAGRSVWLYAPGELFYTTISLIGYLGLRQTVHQLENDSRMQRVVEVLAVGLAFPRPCSRSVPWPSCILSMPP
jgi:hypothetical protein